MRDESLNSSKQPTQSQINRKQNKQQQTNHSNRMFY